MQENNDWRAIIKKKSTKQRPAKIIEKILKLSLIHI